MAEEQTTNTEESIQDTPVVETTNEAQTNPEQFLKDLSDVQLKQKDVLQTVDSRLSKFEPIKVVLDGLEFQVDQYQHY